MARGIVEWFDDRRGVGAISSPELPPGRDAWVHVSAIHGTGPRTLQPGQAVEFQYEEVPQGSFDFRATNVGVPS